MITFIREDQYKPFNNQLNGSKLRLIVDTISKYHKIYNGLKIRANLQSHTLANLSFVCKMFEVPLMCFLKDFETDIKNPLFKYYQAQYDVLFLPIEYYNRLVEYKPFNQRELVPLQVVYDDIIDQVQKVPVNLDYFAIATGSCHTLNGILQGFDKYNNHPNNIIIVSNKSLPVWLQKVKSNIFDYNIKDHYKLDYTQEIKYPFEMDDKFESKMWRFINQYRPDVLQMNTCFWITGNYNFLRNHDYQ